MDSVFVHGLSVRGTHGVNEAERRTEQEFLVDIDALFDAAPSAASDSLQDTVDYVRFVDIATRTITDNAFYLIERLASRIADEIMSDARIAQVQVRVRKPAVLHSGVPGVVVERKR